MPPPPLPGAPSLSPALLSTPVSLPADLPCLAGEPARASLHNLPPGTALSSDSLEELWITTPDPQPVVLPLTHG